MFILICVLSAALAACAPLQDAEEEFVFIYNGQSVRMNEDADSVFAKLGQPRHTFEAVSCAFDGADSVYDYAHFEIYAYPADGKNLTYIITFRDDGVTTPEGVYLGGSERDMLDAYGSVYEREQNMYTYTKGQTYLTFIIEDGVIISITYGLIIE